MKGMHRYSFAEYAPTKRAIDYDQLNQEIFNPYENADYEYYADRERHSMYAMKFAGLFVVMSLIGWIAIELIKL